MSRRSLSLLSSTSAPDSKQTSKQHIVRRIPTDGYLLSRINNELFWSQTRQIQKLRPLIGLSPSLSWARGLEELHGILQIDGDT